MSALCLFDLIAAFDTVDHDLLLLRFKRQFDLRGSVLQWFRSYLTDRSFRVVYCGNTSSTVLIVCSVPQGSVLGPRLFILYTADLADLAEKHDVNLHSFADDTRLYVHCRRCDTSTTVNQLEEVSQKSDDWCQPIVSSLTLTRWNCSDPDQSMVLFPFGSNRPSLRLGANTDSE